MSTIATSDFIAIADSIAKQKDLLEQALGDTGTADTILYGTQQNLDRVLQLNDYEQENDLLAGAKQVQNYAAADRLASVFLSPLVNDLASHVNGLNNYLESNDIRVHPNFADVARQIKPLNIFNPNVVNMGTVTLSGVGTSTFTDNNSIDTNKYGKANLVVEVVSQGVDPLDATITCKKENGDTEDKTVTVTGGASAGTTFDVGTHGTDMYVDVTAVSVTGGQSGDEFDIKTEVERTISL